MANGRPARRESDIDGREFDDLRAQFRHLDSVQGKQGQELASIRATLETLVSSVETIAKRVNTPQATQWGPILTAIGLAASLAVGYATMTTRPLEKAIVEVVREHSALHARVMEYAAELGAARARLDRGEAELERGYGERVRSGEALERLNYRLGLLEGRRDGK